jgi:FkbM family methyltransferase
MRNLPRFTLLNMNGCSILNTSTELEEQQMLYAHVKACDRVLQLGGNIGTSCITVYKLLSENGRSHNVCVEPSNIVLPTLQKNKDINNAKFTILHGILTKSDKELRLAEHGENLNASTITESEGSIVNKFVFSELNDHHKFNVIFADCEGCFPSFIDEFKDEFQHVETIIYEKDYESSKDYVSMEKTLKDLQFRHIVHGFVNVWKRSRT